MEIFESVNLKQMSYILGHTLFFKSKVPKCDFSPITIKSLKKTLVEKVVVLVNIDCDLASQLK